MKPEEAVMALAFLSNPEELTKLPNSCLIRDDSFDGDFRGRLTKGLTKLFSEKTLDLYSVGDKAGNSPSNGNSHSRDGTASSTATPNSEIDPHPGVFFGTVEVRKYPITIGANPSVRRGVPRTIEWDHLADETERHHIDAYERERPNEDRKRGEELLLNGVTRAKMMTNLGFTKSQLFEGIRRAREHCRIGGGSSSSSSNNVNNNSIRWVGKWRRSQDPVSLRAGSRR